MRKGQCLRQNLYGSAPLRFSDHRPVFATFDCRVSLVDEARREKISKELYRRRTADVGEAGSHVGDYDETEDEDLIGYDAIEPGLPPASSDRQKWWLDNKQPARVQVPVPQDRGGQPMALNPNRPSNPFGHQEEQDWISVSRSSSRASLSSLSSSPYEKVTMPNIMGSMAQSPTPRKLPPAHDSGNLAAKVGRMNLANDQTTPPPPPPRRQGTAPPSSAAYSTTSSGASPQQFHGLQQPLRPTSAASQSSHDTSSRGKPAPPVAKKPAHLANVTSPVASHSSGYGFGGGGPTQPSRSSTMGSSTAELASLVGGRGSQPGASKNGSVSAPPKPSRHPAQRGGPMDLLDSLDDNGSDMGGWETLQPSSKG